MAASSLRGVSYDVVNMNVVTVTIPNREGSIDENYKRVRGGLMRSGKKAKKNKHISYYDRKDERC